MKNFKNLYKLLLLLPLTFIVSCDGTDDMQDVLTKTTTTSENTVFIVTDDVAETATLVSANSIQTVAFAVNNTLDADATFTVSVLKDGAPAEENTDYTISEALLTGGDSSGSFDVSFLTGGTYEVVMGGSSDTSLVVVNNKAIFNVAPLVIFTITWDDSYYDYDLFYFDGYDASLSDVYFYGIGDLSALGYSGGLSAIENFSAAPPMGSSYIYIEDYYNDNADIDVTLTVDNDGVIETFDIVMDADKWVLKIEATEGDDGFPEYVFSTDF